MPARAIPLEQRRHPRAQLSLPVRVRWRTPFGMRLEKLMTVDASREGLLVARPEPCPLRSRVWVAFPFDSAENSAVQPEIRARVVRVGARKSHAGFGIAIQLETPKGKASPCASGERRCTPRVAFALPIFVRLAGTPWPEECMTDDISRIGARFETSHVYAPGDEVRAVIPWGEWGRKGEIIGQITRIQPVEEDVTFKPAGAASESAGGSLMSVAVRWNCAERPSATARAAQR